MTLAPAKKRKTGAKARAAPYQVALDIPTYAPILADGFGGALSDGALPTEILGFYGSNRRLRMIRADYPNGWRLDLRVSEARDGKMRITSMTSSVRMVTRPKAAKNDGPHHG